MAYIPDQIRKTRVRDGVSRTVFEIYVAFCEFANSETGFTYVSIERIADECDEIRHNSARTYLKELISKGWLIETYGDDGNGKLVKGVTVKTDKTGWKSLSERSKEIDKKFVTAQHPDKNFVEPDKKIVNADKKFVTPYKESLNQELNQKTNQSKSRGIPVAEMLGDEAVELLEHLTVCTEGMKTRLAAPYELPNAEKWNDVFEFWYRNGYSAAVFLETHDLIDEIRVRKKELGLSAKDWFITPRIMEQNLGKTEGLRNELDDLENGNSTNRNGNHGGLGEQSSSEYLAQLGVH